MSIQYINIQCLVYDIVSLEKMTLTIFEKFKPVFKNIMHLEDFIKFVDKTIDELILYAQMHAGKDYTDYELEFLWQIYGSKIVDGKKISCMK